jgi:hypothetical protein
VADQAPRFHFVATGIGSVPFLDIQGTCRDILESPCLIPFWPQFVRRSHLEDMSIQYSEGLPLLEIISEKRCLAIRKSQEVESELVAFYDHFLSQDIDYFSIGKAHAPGLYELLRQIDTGTSPKSPFIKGQTVGPVTFTAGITGPDQKPVLHHAELLEAMTRGLAIKALWQVIELGKSGKRPLLFLDEPSLSGFGSAFSAMERHQVIEILRTVINYLKEHSNALVGIHCCGNTDWGMLLEAGPDVINFDAFDYLDYFLLYRDDIVRFVNKGGTIAWGIVPTSGFTGQESLEALSAKLEEGLGRVLQWGVERHLLAERSMLTPACGMGTMEPEYANAALDLLCRLSYDYGSWA